MAKYGEGVVLEAPRSCSIVENSAIDSDSAPRIRYEVRGELARRSKAGSLIYALCVPIGATLSGLHQAHRELMVATFLALLIVGLYRTRLILKLEDTAAWDRAFFLCCLGLSGFWGGLVAYLTLFYGVSEICYLWLLISTGICAGATSALAPDIRLMRTSQLVLMGPTVFALFWLATPESISLSGLCLLYSVYLMIQGSALHRGFMLSRRAQLKFEVKSRELEEALRVKSDFLANVSHEIRTPMNGVIGMTEEVLLSDLSQGQRDDLNTVRDSARSLLAVINQILDFSKIEAGMLPRPAREEFVLDAVLSDCLRPFAVVASRKGLALYLDLCPELPGRFRGDPGRLRQILTNLVGNSMKFTTRGWVAVKVTPGEKGPRFQVTDSGEGISPEKLETIFEPFSQADTSLTRSHQGTGLGLSIVQQLVESLDGQITLESEPGRGTTCSFECPQLEPLEDVEPHLSGIRVSLVDDLPERREATTRLLQRWGAEVDIVSISIALEGRVVLLEGENLSHQALETLAEKNTLLVTSLGANRRSLPGGVETLVRPLRAEQIAQVLRESRHSANSKPPEPAEPAPGQRILVAEDQEVNQELVCRMLKRWGFEVTVANNGQEAVERFKEGAFDLILMDVQMPVMDGYQATSAIRALEGGSAVPIIAVTAHAIAGDAEKCLSAGMDAYLSKPLKRRHFKETLDSFLSVTEPS